MEPFNQHLLPAAQTVSFKIAGRWLERKEEVAEGEARESSEREELYWRKR